MAFRLPEFVQETTTSSGVLTTVALGGAVAKRRTIGSGLGNADQSLFVLSDGASPPVWETFLGTYNGGANTVTVNTRYNTSTGSAINWPGSGTRNIWIATLDQQMAPWMFPWSLGFVVRNANLSLAARSFVWAGAAADFVVQTFADGTAGNPTFTQQYDPLRRNTGATTAQRTMVPELILGASSMQFTADPFEIRGSGGAGDVAMKLDRVGTQDYAVKIGVGGSLVDVFNSATFAFPLFDYKESSQGTQGGVQTDTEITLVVPATGTWRLFVLGIMHVQAAAVFTGASGDVQVQLDEKVGGAAYSLDVRDAMLNTSFGATQTPPLSTFDQRLVTHSITPAASTTYKYRLTPVASGNAAYNVTGAQRHSLTGFGIKLA